MQRNTLISRFVAGDDGQDIIEYALLAAAISLVATLAINALGSSVNTVFANQASELQKTGSS